MRPSIVYLALSFFSNRNYEVVWGEHSSEDRWESGTKYYTGWLTERVEHMYRVLTPTGSIFLH